MTIPRRRPKSGHLPPAAKQFRKALDALGLNQQAGARFLDVNERTVRRYLTGERPVDGFVAKVLRYMIAHDLKPGDLDPPFQT